MNEMGAMASTYQEGSIGQNGILKKEECRGRGEHVGVDQQVLYMG